MPENWTSKTIENLAVRKNGIVRGPFGGSLKKSVFVDSGYKVYEQKNAIYSSYSVGDYYINESLFTKMERFKVQRGDFIVSCSGTIGALYRIPDEAPSGIINQALLKLTINPKEMDLGYFEHYFKWDKFQNKITDNSQGGAIKNLVGMNIFRKIEMSCPPLPEQKKIAEILSTWDEAIETNTKLLNSIEKYRASQLSNYFLKAESSSAKKSLEELENSGSIKLGRGMVISRDEMKSSKGLFPVYSSSIKNNGLMGYIDEYLFDEEMITWSIDGGGNFFYRERHKFSVTNVSGFLKIMDGNIKPYFLANQLQYLHSRLVFDYQTKAHPSVIRSLYKVQIPSINEQIRFEYLFKSFDTQIEKINQYINELQKQKQGLMQRLLTGKVRVKLD